MIKLTRLDSGTKLRDLKPGDVFERADVEKPATAYMVMSWNDIEPTSPRLPIVDIGLSRMIALNHFPLNMPVRRLHAELCITPLT